MGPFLKRRSTTGAILACPRRWRRSGHGDGNTVTMFEPDGRCAGKAGWGLTNCLTQPRKADELIFAAEFCQSAPLRLMPFWVVGYVMQATASPLFLSLGPQMLIGGEVAAECSQ